MNTEELLKNINQIGLAQSAAHNDYLNARDANLTALRALIETFPIVDLTPDDEDDLHDDIHDALGDISSSFEANLRAGFNRGRNRVALYVEPWQSSHC